MNTTMDNLPNELLFKVFENLVDITDYRNCRLVSQKWKRTVMEAFRSKFHVVFSLTDSTLHTASQLKEVLLSFNIYSFTGKENKDAWATSGIEPLMKTTEWLQFSGSEVGTSEIPKFLGLAHSSLQMLSFKCIEKDLASPFLKMQESFSALRKVSLAYHAIQNDNDNFKTFTSVLEKWTSLDCRVQLPLLESLNLLYDSRAGTGYPVIYTYMPIEVTTEELFRNYVAIGKLLLKYKRTLREVQIERISYEHFYRFSRVVQPQWAEMERGLEALDELNLNRLQVTHKTAYYNSTDPYFGTGIELLGQPKNLKNLLYNNLMCTRYSWNVLIATLPNLNSLDDCHLTSIKMNLMLELFSDRTMVINLGALKNCANLRTLWINAKSPNTPTQLSVINVELLPKGISKLRFEKPVRKLPWTMGEEIHVTQQQIRWIIDNLRELESFWVSLVTPERTNENENNEQRQDGGAENIEGDHDAQPQQHDDVNRLANINSDTFRDLITMPKIKDLKVNIMNATALSLVVRRGGGINVWEHGEEAGLPATLNVAREYTDLCEASGFTTTTTSRRMSGLDTANIGYATLIIQRN